MLISNIKNTIRMGLRNHGLKIVALICTMVIGASWIGGSFSPRQPQTVALDVGISIIRILMTLLSLYWLQELIGKEIERKTILWSLSYPQSRSKFLLGRFIGIIILLAMALFLTAAATQIAGHLALGNYQQTNPIGDNYAFWLTISLFAIDLLVVSSFTLMIASISTVPMLPFFLGLAFSVCSRSIGPTLSYLASASGKIDPNAQSLSGTVTKLAWILPDLSRLDIRHIALYQIPYDSSSIWQAILQSLFFSMMMLSIAISSFNKREFG